MVLWQREAPRIKWEGGDLLWLTNLSFFSEKLKNVDSVKSRWMKKAWDCAIEKSIAKLLMGVKIFWWVWSVLILLIVLTPALHHLSNSFFPTTTMISTIFYQTLFLTRNLSIIENDRESSFFIELKHILQNFAHSNIRTSKTFWCRPARILRCQIRLQYHLLHMWPHTSHQSPGFSRWELDSEGLPWQKVVVELRYHCTVGYSMSLNKDVVDTFLIFAPIPLFLSLDQEFMIASAENETLFHFSMLPLVSVPNVWFMFDVVNIGRHSHPMLWFPVQ